MDYICPTCGKSMPRELKEIIPHTEEHIIEALKRSHPKWVEEDGACGKCHEHFKGQMGDMSERLKSAEQERSRKDKEDDMGIKYVHTCKGSAKCHATNHLCQIVAKRDMGEVKKLIQDPEFYCKNCGRAAHSKGNLCNPAKL